MYKKTVNTKHHAYNRRMSNEVSPQRHSFESMGSQWAVTVWDSISAPAFDDLMDSIMERCTEFEQLYSRFRPDSFIRSLAMKTGICDVPTDLITMLRLCEQLNRLSDGTFNPLIGSTLEDMGYDETYSLTPKNHVRSAPEFSPALHIIDDTHIDLHEPVLIDIGAVGKGYAVDLMTKFLDAAGLSRFLVDGSGDIFYRGSEPLRAGLEHPDDPTKAIGVIELSNCAFCASAGNRRKWNTYHHIIDPRTLTSPQNILGTWVKAESAALADALATAIFLCDPDMLTADLSFEYCILNSEYRVRRSAGFEAELF
jgi:FAD:protein FMN transferase